MEKHVENQIEIAKVFDEWLWQELTAKGIELIESRYPLRKLPKGKHLETTT